MRRGVVSLALAAAAACGAVQEPAGPPPFQGVRSVALVRWREPDAARPKDPLDALRETLAARGTPTRVVEVGRRVPDALRPVQRLHDRTAGQAEAAWSRRRSDRVRRLGAEAAEAVRGLGVDAVVLYHRSEDWRFAPLPEPRAFAEPGLPPRPPVRRPVGAFTIVDASGAALSIAWGSPGEALDTDPDAPLNAAEAIDAVVRALSGAREDG